MYKVSSAKNSVIFLIFLLIFSQKNNCTYSKFKVDKFKIGCTAITFAIGYLLYKWFSPNTYNNNYPSEVTLASKKIEKSSTFGWHFDNQKCDLAVKIAWRLCLENLPEGNYKNISDLKWDYNLKIHELEECKKQLNNLVLNNKEIIDVKLSNNIKNKLYEINDTIDRLKLFNNYLIDYEDLIHLLHKFMKIKLNHQSDINFFKSYRNTDNTLKQETIKEYRSFIYNKLCNFEKYPNNDLFPNSQYFYYWFYKELLNNIKTLDSLKTQLTSFLNNIEKNKIKLPDNQLLYYTKLLHPTIDLRNELIKILLAIKEDELFFEQLNSHDNKIDLLKKLEKLETNQYEILHKIL